MLSERKYKHNACSSCEWAFQCPEDHVCPYYHPIYDEGVCLIEYLVDSMIRCDCYNEIVNEMGGGD
jgi:hypothetical protein